MREREGRITLIAELNWVDADSGLSSSKLQKNFLHKIAWSFFFLFSISILTYHVFFPPKMIKKASDK